MVKIFDFPKYYSIEINTENGLVSVKSKSKHAKGRELSQYINMSGYKSVKLNNKTVPIHYLVTHFMLGERPSGLVVNHKDGNKLNNTPDNLEYVSIAENIKHSIENGLHICCNPEKMISYKDGRCKDRAKYKRDWYIQNRSRILMQAKQKYKDGKSI